MTVFCFLMLFTKSETSRKEKNGEMRLMFLRRLHVLSRFNVAVNNSLLVINFHRRVAAALQARKCLHATRRITWGKPPFRLGATKDVFRILVSKLTKEKEKRESARESHIGRERALRAYARNSATTRELFAFLFFSSASRFFPSRLFRRRRLRARSFRSAMRSQGIGLSPIARTIGASGLFLARCPTPARRASASGECFRRSATSNNAAREIRK